jgi:hypothetical protein
MFSKKLFIALCLMMCVVAVQAQDFPRWNFNIGAGVGFPLSTTSNFAGNGANITVGGGRNFSRFFGVSGEFMWNDLPVKQSVINALGVPDASASVYAVTGNAILRIPTSGRLGAYVIGGGGWYRQSGEATAPALVPGTVCPGFWVWWGTCVSGLWPSNVVLGSTVSNSFGGNIGGGITVRLGDGGTKFYTEVRYHHAPHDNVNTDLLPLTFGFRW